MLRSGARSTLARLTPRTERAFFVLSTAALWSASGLAIEGLSFVPGLAPPNAWAWRLGLGIPSVVLVVTILRVGPRLSMRGLMRGQLFVYVAVVAVNVTLLHITPATFAVLDNLVMIALGCAYVLQPRLSALLTVLLSAVALTPLLSTLPGDARASAPAWLSVYLPTLWVVVALMQFRRQRINRARAEAAEQALTDPLTGLGNLRRLRAAAEALGDGGDRGGLLLIDLDNFKAANTLHGHPGGDRALRVVADAVRSVTCAPDTAARIGGDEIAILAPDASPERLDLLARTYRDAIRAANARLQLPGVRLDASVGVAARPRDGRTLGELLASADRAMYAVKAQRPARRAAARGRLATVGEDAAPRPAEPQAHETGVPRVTPVGAARAAGRTQPLRRRIAASVLAGASATTLVSLALPGAPGAHRTAAAALCLAGLVAAAAIACAAPARALSHPGAEAVSGAVLVALISLTGGAHSPALALVLIFVLQQSAASPSRSLAWRLITPAAIILTPFLYQDPLAGPDGATTGALLFAAASVCVVVTLTMHAAEDVLHRLRKRARERAATDPLTGLANRRAFNERFERAVAGRPQREVAVVMLDLDNFSEVNTVHGHRAGDLLLADIAEALRAVEGPGERCLARVGGDEFAAVLPDAGTLAAHAWAERLLAAVSACTSRSPDAARSNVSASAGYAVHPGDGRTLEEIFARADKALMDVKRGAKGHARASATAS